MIANYLLMSYDTNNIIAKAGDNVRAAKQQSLAAIDLA